ncbi:MAG: CoA transferase, partial [Actinobacteria bacterium]|nr:CoA transferase [Actinomycetota bacterium]
FERSRDRVGNWAAAVDLLNAAAATRPAAEVVRRCQERKIICEQIVSPGELVTGDQWRDRHMVVTHPTAGDAHSDGRPSPVEHALGPMFRIDGGGFTTGRAPALDAHGPTPARPRRAASNPAAMNDPTVTAARATPVGGNSTLLLSGLRVVDLTTAWSGPMATRGLAYFGAEVIKVEPPTRLDAWRGMYLGRTSPFFPDSDGGERRFNRCCSFNTQGHDKASFGLDITAPGGREVMADLLACSDVLIANYSSGVLDRLGFGHAATRTINPRLIVVEMPAFGAGGPLSGHVAMGSTMEAACSMASLIGYGDGRPTLTGSTILDPIGGLNGTAAVLVALRNRQRTGVGCHVEVAQTEVAAHWIGEYLLAALEGVDVPPPEGNTVAEAEPHDAYPCSGRDQWVAISVPDDTAWRGLCTTIGEPGLADDERFSTPSARTANRAELAAYIGAWTARHTKLDAAAKLQAKGCPAAPVNRGADVFFDPALRASGFIVSEDHPEAGRSDYPDLAYRLDRTPGSIRTPAPLFGADNRRILESILGYGATRIDELYANAAVCDAPYNPRKQRPGTGRAVEGAT